MKTRPNHELSFQLLDKILVNLFKDLWYFMLLSDWRSLLHRLKILFIGKARDVGDKRIFYSISLIAIFAWIGLGADPLSSSCYGPAEAFAALGKYHYLGIFIAIGTAITITFISMSYSQTIELFPSGGGGYIVASKLHSPLAGVVSGSALLIDYILTISVSVTAGADAIFSFLPSDMHQFKVVFALLSTVVLIILNLRGVKESILTLAPIFLTFVITHIFAIGYALITHLSDYSQAITAAESNIVKAHSELGLYGMIFLAMKAFSMGAGTFTGIEAVSNGLPILREPKVRTAKRTMKFIAVSLSLTAGGLMVAYLLFGIEPQSGKTLNAVLFERLSFDWGSAGMIFVYITLISEAALLFVAAQAGFIDGPRILSNMALDRWMPAKFSMLSDRLVAKNGILIIGVAAILVIFMANGSLEFLIVLYSINIFITFILTESGMVRHWWQVRREEPRWKKKMSVNATSLIIDTFILITVIIMKFHQGGWITLIITASVVILSLLIRMHYNKAGRLLRLMDVVIEVADSSIPNYVAKKQSKTAPGKEKTAIILVNGYNGLGLHTLLNTMSTFGDVISKYVFVQVGLIDSGNFKGAGDVDKLQAHIRNEADKYVRLMKKHGFDADCYTSIGIDILVELENIISQLKDYYMDVIVFGGQIIFKKESLLTRILHNNIVYSLQRKLFTSSIQFVLVPVKV